MASTSVGRYSPLLGTLVEVRVRADRPRAVEDAVVAELVRLQGVFSVFDPGSELVRWRSGARGSPSADLVAVLAGAERLHRCSGGAFHPAVGVLLDRWRRAAAEARVPAPEEMAALAAANPLPFRVAEGRVEHVGPCDGVDLNAIAKGYAVDRALAAGVALGGVDSLVVNAGGDLAHRGAHGVRVGVEDPLEPVDNGRPLATIEVTGRALATSGRARRGFVVAGRWFGHVLDPRTGWPRDEVASASVLADTAMAADGLATVALVAGPLETVACATGSAIDWLVVDASGAVATPARTAFRRLGRASDQQEQHDSGDGAEHEQDDRGAAAPRDEQPEHEPGQGHEGQHHGHHVDAHPPGL